ncbi:MAG: hypothetical protein AB8H79_17605 [Myxococcota bacterium]
MHLATEFRETLVDELDTMLDAYGKNPDPEPIATFLIDQLEQYADEYGIDDIVQGLEESGELEAALQEALEAEMSSNDEFEYTGEELVSLLERLCNVEWSDDENMTAEDEDDFDDDA